MSRGPAKRLVEKVVCYIVRDEALLVFTHLDEPLERTGVQVPSGTIRPDESPDEAALREAREETGLAVSIERALGTTEYDISPARFEIAHRHFFLMRLRDPNPPERWIAGEDDPEHGPTRRWECRWLPLRDAHVLAAGQGAMLGALSEAGGSRRTSTSAGRP